MYACDELQHNWYLGIIQIKNQMKWITKLGITFGLEIISTHMYKETYLKLIVKL